MYLTGKIHNAVPHIYLKELFVFLSFNLIFQFKKSIWGWISWSNFDCIVYFFSQVLSAVDTVHVDCLFFHYLSDKQLKKFCWLAFVVTGTTVGATCTTWSLMMLTSCQSRGGHTCLTSNRDWRPSLMRSGTWSYTPTSQNRTCMKVRFLWQQVQVTAWHHSSNEPMKTHFGHVIWRHAN